MVDDVPVLAGVRHLKLPVADLSRSLIWYESRLGHRRESRRRPDATIGWILPDLQDPDGHQVRFSTIARHTDPATVTTAHDPRERPAREAGAAP